MSDSSSIGMASRDDSATVRHYTAKAKPVSAGTIVLYFCVVVKVKMSIEGEG